MLRIRPREPVIVRIEGAEGAQLRGAATNLSEGGACVLSRGDGIQIREDVIVWLEFPQAPEPVPAVARVVWTELIEGFRRTGLVWLHRGPNRARLHERIRECSARLG